MRKCILSLFIVTFFIIEHLNAQCSLSTTQEYTQGDVVSCLSTCGCDKIIIPDDVEASLDGDLNLVPQGDLLIELQGLNSALIFTGQGNGANPTETLFITAGSSLIINPNNTDGLQQSNGAGQVRIVHGSTEYKGNQFDDIISNGGINIAGPLPVDLLDFTAEVISDYVSINWSTASEKNNDYFEVERSSNGKDFVKIGTVNGNGTTNETIEYSFNDYELTDGITYYRIKQVDYDGVSEYSEIVYVELTLQNGIQIYPNPFDEYLSVYVEDLENNTSLTLKDVTGQTVYTTALSSESTIINTSDLNSGNYFVELVSPNSVKRLKVIKK